jgi:hypothetical protein
MGPVHVTRGLRGERFVFSLWSSFVIIQENEGERDRGLDFQTGVLTLSLALNADITPRDVIGARPVSVSKS